jgi:hypothetical protein
VHIHRNLTNDRRWISDVSNAVDIRTQLDIPETGSICSCAVIIAGYAAYIGTGSDVGSGIAVEDSAGARATSINSIISYQASDILVTTDSSLGI